MKIEQIVLGENASKDFEPILALIKHWYAMKKWAEGLICSSFTVEKPEDILRRDMNRGIRPIPNTSYFYRLHGSGVDISLNENGDGGIDFDFNCEVDPWRLRRFLVKQYKAGKLVKRVYRPFIQDLELWENAIKVALKK